MANDPVLHADFVLAHLTPNDGNPRTITKAGRTKLAASITRHGYVGTMVARHLDDGTHRLIAGHQCLRDLLARGRTVAPCWVVVCSDQDEQHLALTLNGHAGEWDDDRLTAILRQLAAAGEAVDQLMISTPILDRLMATLEAESYQGETDPDAIPPLPETPITRPGDYWILGPHRLICGDSTDPQVIARLVGEHPAHLVFTDPPYGVSYEGAAGTIANDDLPEAELREFLTRALSAAAASSRPGAAIYICHADTVGAAFRLAAAAAGWSIRQTIIWVKNAFVLSRQDYHWRHEPILYGWKPGAAHEFHGGRAQDTVWEDAMVLITEQDPTTGTTDISLGAGDALLCVRGDYETLGLIPPNQSTVWRFDRPSRSTEHPTMKPVALVERALLNSSTRASIVLDPFGGSGSTLIACERQGRIARLVELDPRFCDVIVERWKRHTGMPAVCESL